MSRMGKSVWFDKLQEDIPKLDPHLHMKRLKLGFWRIYWKDHYVGECYENMPEIGYDFEGYDPRVASQQYYEEFEDHVETVNRIKNFVEGYRDLITQIKKRVWMLKHDQEFHERSKNAYKQAVIK